MQASRQLGGVRHHRSQAHALGRQQMLRPAIGSNDNWFLDYAFPTTVFGEGGKLIDAQGNTYIDVPEVYNG